MRIDLPDAHLVHHHPGLVEVTGLYPGRLRDIASVGHQCRHIGAPTTGSQQGGCQNLHASNAPWRGHEVIHLELLAGVKPICTVFLIGRGHKDSRIT